MKEILVSGKKYRVLVDSVNKIWHRISYWTKASDVQFDDGTYLEGKSFGHASLERKHIYEVGDIAYCASAPSWVQLQCVTAGTSATNEPEAYTTIGSILQAGDNINDGSVTFKIIDVRLSDELEDSAAKTPSMKLVKSIGNKVDTAIKQNENIRVYVANDGKLHFKDAAGADSALNFNVHKSTYTFPTDDVGTTKDLGEVHDVLSVNAQNVYAKGLADGLSKSTKNIAKIEYTYHHHSTNDNNADNHSSTGGVADNSYLSSPAGCFKRPYYHVKYSYTNPINNYQDRCGGSVITGCPRPNDPSAVVDYCTSCGKEWGAHTGPSSCDNIVTKQSGGNTVSEDYWTYSASSNIVETRYVCNCGKTNGQIVKQKFYFK